MIMIVWYFVHLICQKHACLKKCFDAILMNLYITYNSMLKLKKYLHVLQKFIKKINTFFKHSSTSLQSVV